MSGASEQPRILEGKEDVNEEKVEEVNEEQSEDIEEVEEEVLEVEQVWIHPKDRPTLSKEERKANQKLVKEQQVSFNHGSKKREQPSCRAIVRNKNRARQKFWRENRALFLS